MRTCQPQQLKLGELAIPNIHFDLQARNGLPHVLMGLQKVHECKELRDKLFALLEEYILPSVDKKNGRPGMHLWSIFVCAVVRLDLNISYDQLLDLVNEHRTLRAMLGHGSINDLWDEHRFGFRALRENVSLLTPVVLDKINKLIVDFGHKQLGLVNDAPIHARCDSFVLETNVHFPTDISLLFDAMRKVITVIAQRCERHGLTDWRQYRHNIKQLKKLMRRAQNKKRSSAQSEEQVAKKNTVIASAHQQYLALAEYFLSRARDTVTILSQVEGFDATDKEKMETIERFMAHAVRQINQTYRRVILGETIPQSEKVYSVFEEYTEWKSKGKSGVPVELGLNVAIVEDSHRFILHYRVMQNECDADVPVHIVKDVKSLYPGLEKCSFDKGFYSKENLTELEKLLKQTIMPRKGTLTAAAKSEEHAEDFVKARRAHSAVESAINALEVHGLDRCPDRGIDGFKRYVSLAIVARNIHRIGDIAWEKACKRQRRQVASAANDSQSKLAA